MNCIWFRQDLRVKDHNALYHACENSSEGVVGLFVLTPETWLKHHWSDGKVSLMLHQLENLSRSLWHLNIPLKILDATNFEKTPQVIQKFCCELGVKALHFNEQFLIDESKRDKAVVDHLSCKKIEVHRYHDLTVFKAKNVLKKDGTPFKVFTPFYRNWLKLLENLNWAPKPLPSIQKAIHIQPDPVTYDIPGFHFISDLGEFKPGETAAMDRLNAFIENGIENYKDRRDFPNIEGTSKLSAYLALGIISSRVCVKRLLDVFGLTEIKSLKGPSCYLSEIAWREFYYAIAYHFPEVVKHKPFQPKTDLLPWSYDEDLFSSWCEGKTGFPIVDAAMRCLNQTGWMHNRLRMICAMFLTKLLFIDWRMGEAYFMRKLIDGDFPSNNGGWQWSASTGTDAAPYFRIFNTTTQSERFDSKGDFIKQFCPELEACDEKEVHNPSVETRLKYHYPQPVVDYKLMRKTVIEAFKALKEVNE